MRVTRKSRWLLYFISVVVIFFGFVLLYALWSNRMTSANFEKLTALNYDEATREVKKHARGRNLTETYFGTDRVKCECLLDPGSSTGVNPRFVNVGKTQAHHR